MTDHTHRGALPGGPFVSFPDRRVTEIDAALRAVEAVAGRLGPVRDPARAAASLLHRLDRPGHVFSGVVVHPLPHLNWYKVQTAEAGTIACCSLVHGTLLPHGPKPLAMAGPNEAVLVFKPHGLHFGLIVGVLPTPPAGGLPSVPDWVSQGSGVGVKREPGYRFPLQALYQLGGVVDWSANRPLDQTPLDQGWVTPTGLALTIDDEMVQLRVHEMCGLFATLYDGWLRLAGCQLLTESLVHETEAGDDEGESRYFHGIAAYPHEALGQYAPGRRWTAEYDDHAVHYTGHKAKVDLPDGGEDLQPIYRYQEYGGYLGQGHVRLVMRPAADAGPRRHADADRPDVGLFLEAVGLDGSYTLLSAKSLHIGKRCQIVVPKQLRPPADKGGDDAERGGYRFSSLYGTGPEHRVGDVRADGGPVRSVLRAASVLDLLAYDAGWKYPHPFYYHRSDYRTWQPSELAALPRDVAPVPFGGDGFFVADPEPRRLRIDHRYGQVEYFERESFVRFFDDGSVMIGSGCGVDLLLAGGRLRLNAPKGVDVCPGTDFTVLADQIVLRARGSVDVSSSDRDVRIKAERNMQLLAGNGGQGGVLVESKGEGTVQDFADRYGEDVVSNGVTLRAARSAVAAYGGDVYLRTGGAGLADGDVVVDAAKGRRRVQLCGKEVNAYTTGSVNFVFGPAAGSAEVDRVYHFGEKTMVADVKLMLGGRLVGYHGGGGPAGVVVDGGVYATQAVATAGAVASRDGRAPGRVPSGFADTVRAACAAAQRSHEEARLAAAERYRHTVADAFYAAGRPGDDGLVAVAQFSFRDPPGSVTQYRSDGFLLPESRWQQYVRFGMGHGGVPWVERPVVYQGRPTYPWPGKQKWVDEANFLLLDEMTMFDPAAGRDRDRPGPYETDPRTGGQRATPADGHFTLNR